MLLCSVQPATASRLGVTCAQCGILTPRLLTLYFASPSHHDGRSHEQFREAFGACISTVRLHPMVLLEVCVTVTVSTGWLQSCLRLKHTASGVRLSDTVTRFTCLLHACRT